MTISAPWPSCPAGIARHAGVWQALMLRCAKCRAEYAPTASGPPERAGIVDCPGPVRSGSTLRQRGVV
ncbi:hypothetical protein SAMN04490357_1716 [Streptomyces misionensis]|uniref:Uncharacterized protein n=1 Tax=Streptomyces misionensis TaxID=67331 RepID=A0A1H4RKB3_9ACTN|nr:hypothetical protein SAMN04490357_1716 [Streptomyces misionensis]